MSFMFKKWTASASYLYMSMDFTVEQVNDKRKKKELLISFKNDRNTELGVLS